MVAQLDDALPMALAARLSEEQRQAVGDAPRGGRLAVLAAALGLAEGDALAALAAAANLDIALNLETDPDARGVLPARLVHDFQIIPIRRIEAGAEHPADSGDRLEGAELARRPLHLASTWPPSTGMEDWIRTFTSRPLFWHLAVPERVHQLIIENFGVGSGSLEDSDDGYVAPETQRQAEEVVDEDAAVVRFVTDVISQAVDDQATDIHFEPQEGQLRIRYRVDGLLVPVPLPENLLRFQDAIISRLKIMARLNISEKRLPQDGRINFKGGGTTLDIRVSTIPTIYAESVSLRLLNKKKEAFTMDRLGMSADEQTQIIRVLDYPHGIILVTGPTGSGKSTSLNAFLRKINSTDLRIITIEDPIEYEVPGVNQMQVRPEIGLTFADALRHVLRQDPDVIMVGEIRDQGYRRDRDSRLADRTPGLLDAAYQRRPRSHHPARGHGDRAVPRRFGDRTRDRPAPGPAAVRRVLQIGPGQQGEAPRVACNSRLRRNRGRSYRHRSSSRSAAIAAAEPATAAESGFSRSSA
jgi:general secretion pathway protein E